MIHQPWLLAVAGWVTAPHPSSGHCLIPESLLLFPSPPLPRFSLQLGSGWLFFHPPSPSNQDYITAPMQGKGKKIKVLVRASSWLLAQAVIGQHNLLWPVPRSALPGPDCRTWAPMSPRMLERRGHGGEVALWMEQGHGAAVAVEVVVTLGSCAAAPRPGWTVLGVVLGC